LEDFRPVDYRHFLAELKIPVLRDLLCATFWQEGAS
jgi:hypothetical protein